MDCKELVAAGFDYMMRALVLAYADDQGVCEELITIRNSMELTEFVKRRQGQDDITFIVDQHNDLWRGGHTASADELARNARAKSARLRAVERLPVVGAA